MFSNVMENVNMTEVAKAVPTIFKGASQAFALLESMGMMETLPGSETKADVADKEQDEEEEEEEWEEERISFFEVINLFYLN